MFGIFHIIFHDFPKERRFRAACREIIIAGVF
jgi:hypothetical protein